MKITVKFLKENEACADQVLLFEKTFGAGATLNLENLKKAAAAGLELDWLAEKLLSGPAWKVYDVAKAEAWKVYRAAKAEAWKVYRAAKASAWKVYDAAEAEAWKVYDAAKAPAQKFYEAATAEAFWRAWLSLKLDLTKKK